MSKNTYHHGDLRNALLEGAYRMLTTDGINNLSLRKVAKHIGVSHNAPYQHFADKEALIASLAEQGFRELKRVIDETIDTHADQSTVEQLVAIGHAYVKFMSIHPAYLEVMFGSYPHKDYSELSAVAIGSLERLVAVVEAGQANGEIKVMDAREIAGTIWMTIHGISTVFQVDKIPPQIVGQRTSPELAATFVQIVCDGIRA